MTEKNLRKYNCSVEGINITINIAYSRCYSMKRLVIKFRTIIIVVYVVLLVAIENSNDDNIIIVDCLHVNEYMYIHCINYFYLGFIGKYLHVILN